MSQWVEQRALQSGTDPLVTPTTMDLAKGDSISSKWKLLHQKDACITLISVVNISFSRDGDNLLHYISLDNSHTLSLCNDLCPYSDDFCCHEGKIDPQEVTPCCMGGSKSSDSGFCHEGRICHVQFPNVGLDAHHSHSRVRTTVMHIGLI